TAEQPRRKDTRVVDDQQIAWSQPIGQRANRRVMDGAALAIEVKKTGRRPLGRRLLRDEIGRQLEVELADVHVRAGSYLLVTRARAADCLPAHSVLGQKRPERLIEVLAAAVERSPQYRFLHGADLLKRAVATAVLECRARLEASRADHLEREVDDE